MWSAGPHPGRDGLSFDDTCGAMERSCPATICQRGIPMHSTSLVVVDLGGRSLYSRRGGVYSKWSLAPMAYESDVAYTQH